MVSLSNTAYLLRLFPPSMALSSGSAVPLESHDWGSDSSLLLMHAALLPLLPPRPSLERLAYDRCFLCSVRICCSFSSTCVSHSPQAAVFQNFSASWSSLRLLLYGFAPSFGFFDGNQSTFELSTNSKSLSIDELLEMLVFMLLRAVKLLLVEMFILWAQRQLAFRFMSYQKKNDIMLPNEHSWFQNVLVQSSTHPYIHIKSCINIEWYQKILLMVEIGTIYLVGLKWN